MKLENWALVSSVRGPDSRYTAPELVGVCLVGDVYGDDRRFDGTRIRTSLVISIGSGKARTFSESVYLLGAVDERYLEKFPAASDLLAG